MNCKNLKMSLLFAHIPNIKISNEDLRKNLDKIHLFLTSKKNQTKGSIICTLIENSLSSIQLMLGIMYSGMIQVPLNLIAGEEQLILCCKSLRSTNYFCLLKIYWI